jgi:hypothetical protein
VSLRLSLLSFQREAGGSASASLAFTLTAWLLLSLISPQSLGFKNSFPLHSLFSFTFPTAKSAEKKNFGKGLESILFKSFCKLFIK